MYNVISNSIDNLIISWYILIWTFGYVWKWEFYLMLPSIYDASISLELNSSQWQAFCRSLDLGCLDWRPISPTKSTQHVMWVWINTYENTIFSGMNIHLPAILMWTTGVPGFWHTAMSCPEGQAFGLVSTEIVVLHAGRTSLTQFSSDAFCTCWVSIFVFERWPYSKK